MPYQKKAKINEKGTAQEKGSTSFNEGPKKRHLETEPIPPPSKDPKYTGEGAPKKGSWIRGEKRPYSGARRRGARTDSPKKPG